MLTAAAAHFAMFHLPDRGCASHMATITATITNMYTPSRTGTT